MKFFLPDQKIDKKEWSWIYLMSVVVLFIVSIPVIAGYLFAPSGYSYNGLQLLIAGDYPVYYSYLKQIIDGNNLLYNYFTSEIQRYGTFNIWWFLVGLFGRYFSLTIPILFHLSRIFLIPIFCVVGYIFFSHLFSTIKQRKLAFIFLIFSSGLGFYFAPYLDKIIWHKDNIIYWPIDLWITEAITFSVLLISSHFIVSLILMLLLLLLIYKWLPKKNYKISIWAGLIALIFFNFHPYYVPIIYGVAFFYLLYLFWQAKKIIWGYFNWFLIFFILSFPSVIYHIWLILFEPIIRQRAIQNTTPIAPWQYVFIGYGFLFLGFLFGVILRFCKKKWSSQHIFVFIWFIVTLLAILLIPKFSSRYTQGLHIIFVFFTVDGLVNIYDILKNKIINFKNSIIYNNYLLWFILFILFFAMSNIFNIFRTVYYYSVKPGNTSKIYYIEEGLISAYDWLDKLENNQIIISSEIPAKFTPGFSGQIAYAAHAHETLYFDEKMSYVLWFYADNNIKEDSKKYAWLRREGIDYVLYSPYEKDLGSFQPQEKDYLRPVFSKGQTTIYEVLP